ncbi:endonuclease/exonuclease/phosphatase family protein [Runella slithyformis]|nr:endonuclease/exonuclease/phosphatase family protein [Runella slithyformis]
MVRLLTQAVKYAPGLVLFASLIGFLGEYSRWFDHFSAFRVQYCFLSLLLSVYQFYQKQWRLGVLTGLLFLFNGWLVAPWLLINKTISVKQADFKVYHANVLFKNLDYLPVTQQIIEEKPDFISINEATPPLIAHLKKSFAAEYPYTFFVSAKNDTKVFVASRTPIEIDSAATFAVKGLIRFTAKIHGKPLTIIACHAYNPLKQIDFLTRNQELRHIAALVKKERNPTLVIGDLNITPWSVIYQKTIAESYLKNARQGFGLKPSWPAWMPFLLIPIDHCLINRQLEAVGFERGKHNKSDHYPLIIHLRFRK